MIFIHFSMFFTSNRLVFRRHSLNLPDHSFKGHFQWDFLIKRQNIDIDNYAVVIKVSWAGLSFLSY